MKKQVFLLLVALWAMMQSAFAYDFSAMSPSGHTLFYNIVNGEARVTPQNSTAPFYSFNPTGALIIPDSVLYNGTTYVIAAIENSAFKDCSGLTSVTIPNSVTTMGDYVFQNCTGLTSINIPNGVTSIGMEAFYGCSGLTSVSIGNGIILIRFATFRNCSSLTSFTIPSSVTSIGDYAFMGCSDLISVTIPNSVTSIGYSAFSGCTSLTSVAIPSSITSIGYSAFSGCYGLTSVAIPNSVTSISANAFSGCNGLAAVIPNSVTTIGTGAFGNVRHIEYYGSATGIPWGAHTMNGFKDGDFYYSDASRQSLIAYSGYGGDVIIPSTVNNIGRYAFSYCGNLTLVTIPSSVTSIGSYAFQGCSSLTSITIPPSVISIDSSAFLGSGLTVIYMKPTTPPTLGDASSLRGYLDVVVPHNSYDTYTNAGANYTRLYFYRDSLFVSTTVNDSVMGYIVGNNTLPYPYSDTLRFSAIPYYGYHFTRWDDNTTDSILQIADFTLGSINRTVTAYFAKNKYSIYLAVDTSIHGSCTGSGNYNYLSERTIKATAKTGYQFVQWSDGITDNPRVITLTQDTSFIALFERKSFIITVLSNDETMGSVSGGDTVLYQDSVIISATANQGYHFDKWNDNSTNNPRFVLVTGNKTYIAQFTYNQYNITLNVDTSIHGTCIGDGNYNYLSNCTIQADANAGYHFTSWNDSVTENPRIITLTQDTQFMAYYAKNSYTLTFQSDNSMLGVVNMQNASGEYLDTVSVLATAIPHYHFVRWNDDDTENPRRFVLDDNRTYTAYFAIDEHTVSLQVDNMAHGTVSGAGTCNYGQSVTVSATPYDGYQFSHWNDGSTYNPYTLAVIDDVQLTAYFYATGTPYQDTIYIDTLFLYDTTYIDVHDTTYIDVPYPVHDTTVIHDTSYVDVYVPVHDTTYIDVHDTTIVVHVDTLTVIDTLIVTDTLWLTQYDTIIIHDTVINNYYQYDTTLVNVYDTVIKNLYQYDTTLVNVYDTTIINIYDTTIVNNSTYTYDTAIYNHFQYDTTLVFDTMIVNVYTYDTSIYNNYQFDTVILNYYQYDTTIVNDTVINNYYQYDTTLVNIYDTTIVNVNIYDTTINNLYQYDTIIVNNYIYDTVVVNHYHYDTTIVNNHDTVNNYFYDTVIITHYYHDTVIVNNYVYDTIYLNRYIFDTIWMYDTIIVHDTIYINQEGIDGADAMNAKVYSSNGQIVVEGAEGYKVMLYDVNGRVLATKQDEYTPMRFDAPVSGTYMIKIGNYPARKVVVVR